MMISYPDLLRVSHKYREDKGKEASELVMSTSIGFSFCTFEPCDLEAFPQKICGLTVRKDSTLPLDYWYLQ